MELQREVLTSDPDRSIGLGAAVGIDKPERRNTIGCDQVPVRRWGAAFAGLLLTMEINVFFPTQGAGFLLPAMAKGDFYILCPDNDVTRGMDERRIRWAAEDIIENRPALSRWHPDFEETFAAFMAS